MAKKLRKTAFTGAVGYIIIPLMAINFYAFWKLKEASGYWAFSVIPGNTAETLTQLAIILAINNVAIIFLLVYIKFLK